ncbi:MAG: formate/nitrite transporter family protein [Desulfobacterales bacterium]|nr:formate/nitrite transporter family protein [Desulfobacterales bacterium]
MKEQDKQVVHTISPEAITELAKKAASDCLPPPEVARKAETVGVTKAKLDILSTVLLGMLAGAFIGLGAMLCTLVTTDAGLGFGLTKLLGGVAFCLGLILVVVAGAELFTGNCLMVMSWFGGKISFGRLLRNWGLVYFANLAGSLALVGLMFYTLQWGFNSNAVGANGVLIANAKVDLSFTSALTRGILCNALVCLAIWLAFSARTVVGKIFGILFPITAFVAAGFEHSIANMYFIPMGILLAKQPAVLEAAELTSAGVANLNVAGFVGNLVPVTIGNIIGGSLLVGAVYWASYLRQERADVWVAIRGWLKTMVPPFRPAEPEVAAELMESKALREVLARAVLAKHAKPSETAALQRTGSKALSEMLARAVLAKAGGDDTFFTRLAQEPDEVLKGYDLNPEERAALSGGDVGWLESRVSTLGDPLGAWVALRLTSKRE